MDNNEITPLMKNYFDDYVNKHVDSVSKIAAKLRDKGYISDWRYKNINMWHDYLKLIDPEYEPYVKRKWQEHVNKGTKFADYNNMDQDVKNAIEHHVKWSNHHPEYWSKDYKGIDSKEPCHVNNMPEAHVIEMICDWKAMAYEYNNTLMDWFKKTDGTRWIWDDKTRALVLKWIKIVNDVCKLNKNFSIR